MSGGGKVVFENYDGIYERLRRGRVEQNIRFTLEHSEILCKNFD